MANLNSNALTQFHAQLTEEFNVPELQQFVQDMEDAEKMQKVFDASKHLHKLNSVEEFSNIFKKKNENSTSTSSSSDGNYCSEGYKFNPQSGLCEPTEESLANFPSLESVKPSSTPPSLVEEVEKDTSVEADFTKVDYTDADSVRKFAMFMEDKFINPTDAFKVDEVSFQAADDIEIVEDQYKKATQEAEGANFQNTEIYSPNSDEIEVEEGNVGVHESEENWLGSLLFGGDDIGLLYSTGENKGKSLSKEDRVKYLAQKKLDVIEAKKDEVLLKVMDATSRDAANASPWDAEIYSNVVPQDVTSGLFTPTDESVEYNINDYNNQITENNNIISNEFWSKEQVRIQDLITKKQTEEYSSILQGILKKYQDKYGEILSNVLPQDREVIQLELTQELQSVRNGLHEKYSLLYQEEIDKSEKQLIKDLKPSTSLLTNSQYSSIDKKLDAVGFGNSNAIDKKYALDNAWYGIKEGLVQGGMESEEIAKRQNEFYYYYYDKIAIDSKGMPTTFAIRDWADDLLAELNTYKSEKIETLSSAAMEGSDSKEALEEYNKDRKSISVVENYLKDILESPEKMSESGFKNFMRGLGSLHTYEYIPFISGIAHLDDNINLYNVAKKKQSGEELTAAENILLTSKSIKQITDERVSDLSTGYNAGKLTANMIPYVGEFVMTSGAFTVGKKATRKILDKALLRHIDNVVTEAGELTIKARAVDGVSWVAGTIAQTAVNPHHYVSETFANMTPEVALSLSSEGDELIESLDADLSLVGKFEGGADDFSTAFLKGFGVTWAEFATERMGEMIPMAGKHIKTKWLNDPEWMKRLMLGRYLRLKGWGKAEAVRSFTKDKMSWNGLLGEIFEETINQPMSNIIQGNTWNEGMDEDFFKELGVSMGATQAVFGGLQLGANIITPQASYIMNGDRYESFKEMQDAMQELKSSGKLHEKDFELNLQIDNDENAFNAAAAFMSQFNRESDVSFKGEQDIADKTSVVKGIIKKVFGGNVDFIEVGGKSEMIETMEKQAAEARNNGNEDLGLEAEIKRLQSDEFANTEGFFRGADGKIYLNTKIATPELIFHESTHKATVKLKEMLGDKYYSKILDVIEKDPRIKKQLSWAITNYYEGKGTQEERNTVLDEAFTEYIAQMAKKKFDAKDSTMQKILEWLRNMLFEANEAGHNTADVEDFISIAEHISTSMAEGSQINIEKDPEGGYSNVNTSFKKANLYKKGDVLIDNVWKKELEFDSNNDVVLYHFSASDKLEGNKLDPKFFGKMAWTEKDAANWGRKRINFHTSPENKEKYYGGTPYIVKMPLDKIYPAQQDPLGFVKKYKADRGMPIDKTLPVSIQMDIIAESIKDYGFKAMMSSWDNKFRVDMFEPVQPVNLNRKETTHDWSEGRDALPQILKERKKDAKQLSYNGLMLEEVAWGGVDKGYKPASQWHVKTTSKISLNSDYKIQRESAPQVTPSGTKTVEVIKVVASPYKVIVKEEYVYDNETKSHKAVDRVIKENTNDYQTIGFFNSVEEVERFITEKEGYEYVKFKKGDKVKALAKTSLISHWVDLIRENHGFTWHWNTGDMAKNSLENKDLYPDGNWSVSLHPDYSLKDVDPANIIAVKEWLAQSESVIESSDYSVGGWINDEGLLYLDIVTLVHEKDLAHKLGSKYNQEGVFDLADGTDAAYSETGGTGESTPEIEAINPHERHLDVVYTESSKDNAKFKKAENLIVDPIIVGGVTYKGKDVSEWTPEEFEEFGNMHDVPNLGPLSALVDIYDEVLGETIQIPNGFEGEFTYYDMMWMKAKGINPSLLSDSNNIELQKKKARSVQPTELNELEVFNRMLFAMLSPNQPLTPNEFEYMALRVRDMEDLERLASFSTWEPHSIKIAGAKDKLDPRVTEADKAMQEHFKTAAAHKGGLGLKSSSNYPAIAEFAKLFLQNPDWFKKKESESWFNFVDRLASQINGLGTKVASFGAVFQDPVHAALSVIDRHMAALYYTEFNQSPKGKAKWEAGIISSWKKKIMDGNKWVSSNKKSIKAYSKNKSSVDKKTANKIEANLKLDAYHKLGYHKIKTLDELLDTSGGNAHFGEIFRKDLSAKKSKLMKKDGTFGDNVTEELKKVDWLIKPEQIQVMSDKYKSALKANEENAINYGLHLFPAQWMEWDIQRRRLEPHEVLFPNLYKLPKMSFDQIKNALIAHRELGYTNSSKESYHDTRKGGLSQRLKPTKEMNPMQPERMAYFRKSSSAEVLNKLESWGVEHTDKPTLELIKSNLELLKKGTWIGFENKNYNPAAAQILADAKERRLLSEEFTVESQISGRALSEEMLSIEDRLDELSDEKAALITYNQNELVGIKKEELNNAIERNQSEIDSLHGRMSDIKSEYSQMIKNEDEIREKRSTLESNKGVFDLFNGAVFLLESITSNKKWSIRTMTLNGVKVRWEEHDLRHIETTVLPEIKNVLFPTTRDSQIRLNDLFRLDGEQKVMLKSYLMDIKKGIGELEMSEVFTPNQILIMDFMDSIIKGDIYEIRKSWENVIRDGLDAPSYADSIRNFAKEFTLLKYGRRVYTIEKSDLTHVVNHNGDIALFDSDDVHDIGMRLGAKDFNDDKMSDREVEVLDIINALHMKPFALEAEIGWVIPHSNETFSSVVDIRSEKLYGGDKYGVVATNIQGDRVIIKKFNANGDAVAIDMLTEDMANEMVDGIKSSNLLPTDVLLPNGVQSIAHKIVPSSSITAIEFEDESNIDTTTKFKKSDNPFATVGIDITKLFQGQQVKLNADPQYLKGYEGEDAETGSLYNIGENVQEEGVDFNLSIDDIKGKQFESGRIKINNSGNPQYIISDKISKEAVESDYEYKLRVTTREEGWRVELNTSINPDIEHNLVSEINSREDQKLIVAHRDGERIYALDIRVDSPILVEEKEMIVKSKLSGSNLIGEVVLRGKSHPLYESVSTNSVTNLISDISDIDIQFELENKTKFKIDLLTQLQNINIVEEGMESSILNSIDESELVDILVNESFARGTDNLLNNTVTNILRATQFRKNKSRDFVFKSEQEILKTGQKSWKPKALIEFLNSPKRAIKKEELDWLGIEEWLKGKDKVSSEQISRFFRGSRMDFREVILGEAQFRQETYISELIRIHSDATVNAKFVFNEKSIELDVDYEVEAAEDKIMEVTKTNFIRKVTNNGDTSHWLSEEEAEEMWLEYLKYQSKSDKTITSYRFTVIKKEDGSIYRDENGSFKLLTRFNALLELESLNVTSGPTQYADYRSEISNEDYQEILFYIPENTRDEFYGLNLVNVKHVMAFEVDGSFTIQWRNGDRFIDIIDENTGLPLSFETKEEADLKVKEFYNIRNKSRVGGGHFTSSHFSGKGKNLLFHMRTMNIKGESGESVLMIEEIQSDLHQKAREKRKEDIKKEMQDIFYHEVDETVRGGGSSISPSAFRELNEGSNLYYPHKGMSLEAQNAAKSIRELANERHPLNNYYHDSKLDGENNIDILTENFIKKHPLNVQVMQDFDSLDNDIIQNDIQVDIDSELKFGLGGNASTYIIDGDFPYADVIVSGNYAELSNEKQLEIHKHWVKVFGVVEYNRYNTTGLNSENQNDRTYDRSRRRAELVVPWEKTKLEKAIEVEQKLKGYVRDRFSLSANDGKLPAAPFKKDWSELLLKQALTKAVAEGNDAISWTTGAEQVRRYGNLLGTVTDEIRYQKVEGGRYDITIMKDGGEKDVKSSLTESEVRELLGDHMTDIIINDPLVQEKSPQTIANIRFMTEDESGKEYLFQGEDTDGILHSIKEKRYGNWGVTIDSMIEKHMEEFHPELKITGPITWGRVTSENAPYGSIKGDNITIGGRGMTMFYDRMIPSFMNKYTKKWGSKYEFIKPQKNYQYQVKDGNGNIIDLTPSDVFVVHLDNYAVNSSRYDWNGQIGEGDIGMYIIATEIDGITRPVRNIRIDTEWDNEMHIEVDESYGSLSFAIEDAESYAEGSKMGRHHLTITDAMKESFKNNGQTLFKKADRGFTERFEDRPTMTYQPQSWDDMEKAAMEKTDTEIVDGLRFSNLLSHDTANNSSVLDGMFLFQKYDSMSRDKSLSEEDRAKAKRQSDELYEKIAVNGTAIAQALSQYGWLKTATPKGMIEMFEKSIGKHGAKINTKQRLMFEELASKDIDTKQAIRVAKELFLKNPSKETLEALSEAQENHRKAHINLMNTMQKYTPKNFWKLLGTILRGNLLTPASQVLNVVGNLSGAPLRVPTNLVRGFVDMIATGATGALSGVDIERSKLIRAGAIFDNIKGGYMGFFEAVTQMYYGVDPKELGKYDVNTGLQPINALIQLFAKEEMYSNDIKFSQERYNEVLNNFYDQQELEGEDRNESNVPEHVLLEAQMFSEEGSRSVMSVVNKVLESFGMPAEAMFRLLPFGDSPFYRGIYTRVIEEQADILGLEGFEREKFLKFPSAKAKQLADEEASRATFQDENFLKAAMNNIRGSLSTKEAVGGPLDFAITVLFPFTGVPSNIAKQTLEYSMYPISFAWGMYKLVDSMKLAMKLNGMKEGSSEYNSLKERVEKQKGDGANYIGIATTGMMIFKVGLMLAADGIIGSGDDDKRVRNASYEHLPKHFINISALKRMMIGEDVRMMPNDNKRNVTRIGPLGIILATAADSYNKSEDNDSGRKYLDSLTITDYGLQENTRDTKGANYNVFDMFMNSVSAVYEQSFLTNVSAMLDAIADPERNMERFTRNLTKELMSIPLPNTMGQATRANQENMTDITLEYESLSTKEIIKKSYREKMFWSADGWMLKRDMFGRPIKRTPKGKNPIIHQMFNPTKEGNINSDKASWFVYNLAQRTGNSKIIPSVNRNYGNGMKWDKEEWLDYQEQVGSLRLNAVNSIVKNLEESHKKDIFAIMRDEEIMSSISWGGKSSYDEEMQSYTEEMMVRDALLDGGLLPEGDDPVAPSSGIIDIILKMYSKSDGLIKKEIKLNKIKKGTPEFSDDTDWNEIKAEFNSVVSDILTNIDFSNE